MVRQPPLPTSAIGVHDNTKADLPEESVREAEECPHSVREGNYETIRKSLPTPLHVTACNLCDRAQD